MGTFKGKAARGTAWGTSDQYKGSTTKNVELLHVLNAFLLNDCGD